MTVNYLTEYLVCAGSILFTALNKCPASGGDNLLQGLLVKCSFELHQGDLEGFDNPLPKKMPKLWMKPRDGFLMKGRYFFTLCTAVNLILVIWQRMFSGHPQPLVLDMGPVPCSLTG